RWGARLSGIPRRPGSHLSRPIAGQGLCTASRPGRSACLDDINQSILRPPGNGGGRMVRAILAAATMAAIASCNAPIGDMPLAGLDLNDARVVGKIARQLP